MPMSPKEVRGSKAFAFPLFGIFLLLACYWVLTDWQRVPNLISAALDVIPWSE